MRRRGSVPGDRYSSAPACMEVHDVIIQTSHAYAILQIICATKSYGYAKLILCFWSPSWTKYGRKATKEKLSVQTIKLVGHVHLACMNT